MQGERICLHLGLPKTATTFLQEHVFSVHPDIRNLGKGRHRDQSRLRFLHNLKAVCRDSDPVYARHKALVTEQVRQYVSLHAGGLPCSVISYEDFFHPYRNPPALIKDRLLELFGGEVRVLITVREQRAWVESLYLYNSTSRRGIKGIEDWARGQRGSGVWNVFRCCDFWATIDMWRGAVGGPRARVPRARQGRSADQRADVRVVVQHRSSSEHRFECWAKHYRAIRSEGAVAADRKQIEGCGAGEGEEPDRRPNALPGGRTRADMLR